MKIVPLLLCNFSLCCNNRFFIECHCRLFKKKFYFDYCLIFALVMGKSSHHKYNIYYLDDGTESIEMKIYYTHDFKKSVKKLFDALKKQEENANRLYNSNGLLPLSYDLRQFLSHEKYLIKELNDIPIGEKVLCYGCPEVHEGKRTLKGYAVFKDFKKDRDLEINFKDYLINFYTDIEIKQGAGNAIIPLPNEITLDSSELKNHNVPTGRNAAKSQIATDEETTQLDGDIDDAIEEICNLFKKIL